MGQIYGEVLLQLTACLFQTDCCKSRDKKKITFLVKKLTNFLGKRVKIYNTNILYILGYFWLQEVVIWSGVKRKKSASDIKFNESKHHFCSQI